MTLPLFEPTYSVSQLCGEIRDFLSEAFASLWVAGEAQRVKASPRGHLYFELVEKGERDEIVGKLEAVIWKTDYARVRKLLAASEQQIAEGMQVRCRGNLDFYGPGGKVQLCVREVDPVFTLGLLERRRRETLAALSAAGLLERNRALPWPELPLKLALITSRDSAAYHDFLSCLAESGYGFQVLFLHASVQGREAEREVASALALLGGLAGPAVDCAVVIRGGGSRSDLAVFDSRRIAEAITLCPFPVLTGLGHEIDQAIADLVAHTAAKTPTKAAELLIERVRRAEESLVEVRRALLREALEPLRRGREALGLAFRLAAAALRGVERGAGERVRLAERLAGSARGRVREARAGLEGTARLCAELAPERTLSRGFSITRDRRGRLLRHPAQAAAGDRITTRVAGGELRSRVEEP